MQSASDNGPANTVTHTNTEGSSETLSKIACHNCRRRKVRCDRKLPVCSICTHNGQQCSYPDRMLKPGPKLGSKNVRNKRRKLTEDGGIDDDIGMHYPGSGGIEQGGFGHSNSPRRTMSMSSSTSTTTTLRNPKDIQSLSFIIHPSHESINSPIATNDTNTTTISQSHYSPSNPSNPNPPTTTTTTSSSSSIGTTPLSPSIPPPSSSAGGALILSACTTLSIPPATLHTLVHSFFNTFPSFRLFASPRFWSSTLRLTDANTVTALLAAICAFAVKLRDPSAPSSSDVARGLTAPRLMDDAMKAASAALAECGDEPPPLALLQALVLVSHWLLIQGVRGRAWRYLGVCIRVAYELNLHLVDSGRGWEFGDSDDDDDDDGNDDGDDEEGEPGEVEMEKRRRWAADEEKRRLWWAIWEMDVFASVIRRCPTAISWLQNETWLPCEDGRWENMVPQRSCVLEISTLARCKSLVGCGNQSPRAWFVVINSIMKDAQTVSSPVGVNTLGVGVVGVEDEGLGEGSGSGKGKDGGRRQHGNGVMAASRRIDEARKRLTTFYNAARYFSMALPQHLKYHGQYLSFEPTPAANAKAGTKTLRELHGQIYSIHVMTQLAYLMTLKYQLFKTAVPASIGAGQLGSGKKGRSPSMNAPAPSNHHHHSSSKQQQQQQSTQIRHPSASLTSATATTSFPITDQTPSAPPPTSSNNTATTSPSVLAYFEASSSILAITHRCADTYFRHVNPFLCNTIWLAAAVQLLRRELYVPQQEPPEEGGGGGAGEEVAGGGATERELVNSEYEVLRMSYEGFVEFWRNDVGVEERGGGGNNGGGRREGRKGGGEKGGGMDLDALEAQLRGFRERAGRGGDGGNGASGNGSKAGQKQRVRVEKGRAAAQGKRESSTQDHMKLQAAERARDGSEQEHGLRGPVARSSSDTADSYSSHLSSSKPPYPSNTFSYPPGSSHARSAFDHFPPNDPSTTTLPSSHDISQASQRNDISNRSDGIWSHMSASTTTNTTNIPSFSTTLTPNHNPMGIDSTSTYTASGDNARAATHFVGDPNDLVMQDMPDDDGELMMMMMFDPAYNNDDGFDYLGSDAGGGYGGMNGGGAGVGTGMGAVGGGNGVGGGGGGVAGGGNGMGMGDNAVWGGYNKFDDVFSGSIF